MDILDHVHKPQTQQQGAVKRERPSAKRKVKDFTGLHVDGASQLLFIFGQEFRMCARFGSALVSCQCGADCALPMLCLADIGFEILT